MNIRNKERRNANISLGIAGIGILAAVLPFLLTPDMESWGFAVAFVGAFIGITAFLVFLMFNGRAKVYKRMFQNENVLVRWQYTPEFWSRICAEDAEQSGTGRIVGFVLGGIFLLISIILYIADTDENELFLMIMAGVAALFVAVGFLSTAAERKRIKNSRPEAVIAREGLFYKNILYTWNNRAVSYLESVSMHPSEPSTILFVLRMLNGGRGQVAHYHRYQIPIPVPAGCEQSAEYLIRYFNLPLSQANWERMQSEDEMDA